ncbi:MAG: TonB family protein [Thermodesulfobacteriota bacterium]
MSDREVGDRDERRRLSGMIMISLVFHTAVLLLLYFSPSFPSPKLTFGPVYTVSLVNFSGKVVQQKAAPAPAKELLAADRRDTVMKKQTVAEPDKSIPIRTLEPRKKKDPDIEKAMEEIRKKATAVEEPVRRPQAKAPPERAPAERAVPSAAPSDRPAAAAAQPGDGEAGTRMHAYYALIWSRIKGSWAFVSHSPGEVLEAVIDVTILRSGAVTELTFEKRSGNRFFDESAMKAIRKASPFPPLPAAIGDTSIQVGIRFHSSDLKS